MTVVSRSSTICEIETFITLESSTITNCAADRIISGSQRRTARVYATARQAGTAVHLVEVVGVIGDPDDRAARPPAGGSPSLTNGPNEIRTQSPPASAPGAEIVPCQVFPGASTARQRRLERRRRPDRGQRVAAAAPLELVEIVVREEHHPERPAPRRGARRRPSRPTVGPVLDRDLGLPARRA